MSAVSDFVSMLVKMGFSKEKAEKGLSMTGNRSVEAAMEWIFSNPGELDPCSSQCTSEAGGSNQNSVPESENSAEKAKSIKCDDCSPLLKSQLDVEYHATKSGHSNFSESTEEKKPLTDEEKQEQLGKIEEKLKGKRKKREENEKEEALEKEKRIQSGKEITEVEKKMDELEILNADQSKGIIADQVEPNVTLASAFTKIAPDDYTQKMVQVSDQLNQKCLVHEDLFIAYCRDCQLNVCAKCAILYIHSTHVFLNMARTRTSGTPAKDREEKNKWIGKNALIPFCSPSFKNMSILLQNKAYRLDVTSSWRKFYRWKNPESPYPCKLLVRKIPAHVYEDQLIEVFQRFGQLQEVILLTDSYTLSHFGVAIIAFSCKREVKNCLEQKNEIYKFIPGINLKEYTTSIPELLHDRHSCDSISPAGSVYCSCYIDAFREITLLTRKIKVTLNILRNCAMESVIDALDNKYLLMSAYHTTLLEENVVHRDDLENIIKASIFIMSQKSLNADVLCELHQMILPKYADKGQFKKVPVYVQSGYGHLVATGAHQDVENHIEIWIKRLTEGLQTDSECDKAIEILSVAIYMHHFLGIHPFTDGNGRVSRIFCSWYLKIIDNSYPWIIFPADSKHLLFQSLETANRGEKSDINLFVKYIFNVIYQSCKHYYYELDRFVKIPIDLMLPHFATD